MSGTRKHNHDHAEPLSFEQLAGHRRPGDARISPDGRAIAFTLKPAAKKDEHWQTAIWLVPFDDGEPRQFTSGLWDDSAPRWSPAGKRLAFLSDRAERGKKSLYVARVDGGEALRIFDQHGEMSSPSWSPDGTRLGVLFTDPETEEEKKRKENRDDAVVWDADPKFQRLWVIDAVTGQARSVSPEGRQVWRYAWSPDGSRLAIATTATPRIDDIFLTTELTVVPLDGGAPRTILRPLGLADNLVWSADGATIAFRAAAGRVVHGDYVYSISADGGEATCLTPGFGGTCEYLSGVDRGGALVMVAVEGVNMAAYRLSWQGERTALLAGQPWGVIEPPLTVDDSGTRVACVWEDADHAPNVWVADLTNGGTLRRRTRFSAELEGAALGRTEIVRWPSDDGVEVEGILVLPHDYDASRSYPLVVQIHGGPTWCWANGFYASWHDWAQLLAGRGYAVLMPNPRGSTGRGPEWSNALFGDVGGGEFRDMMRGVDAMIARGIADPDALGVGGWSWGGYMTAWTVSQTSRFKAAVMGAGLPNMVSDNSIGDIPSANLSYFEKTVYDDPEPYWERSAIRHIRNATTPTLILHGEQDKRVHVQQSVEMYVALRTLGVPTQLVTYPREPHGIEERNHQLDLMRRVVEWYDRYLQPERGAEREPDAAREKETVHAG